MMLKIRRRGGRRGREEQNKPQPLLLLTFNCCSFLPAPPLSDRCMIVTYVVGVEVGVVSVARAIMVVGDTGAAAFVIVVINSLL